MTIQNFNHFVERYVFDKRHPIDSQGYGTIYKTTDTKTKLKLAIKQEHKNSQDFAMLKEFAAAGKLRHENLLDHFGTYSFDLPTGRTCFGLMEWVSEGNLYEFIRTKYSKKALFQILKGILEGLSFLHENNVVYGQLNPRNILIHSDGKQLMVKLSGHGKSILESQKKSILPKQQLVGFLAPEQFSAKDKTTASIDVWSFGVLLYWMLTGDMAFGSRIAGNKIFEIQKNIHSTIKPALMNDLPDVLKTIIEKCLIVQPDKRIQNTEELMWLLEKAEEQLTNETSDFCNIPILNPTFSKPIFAEPLETLDQTQNRSSQAKVIAMNQFKKLKSHSKIILLFVLFGSSSYMGYSWYADFMEDCTSDTADGVWVPAEIDSGPNLKYNATFVDFGTVKEGKEISYNFTVENVGNQAAQISKLLPKGPGMLARFTDPQLGGKLFPGKKTKIEVRLTPKVKNTNDQYSLNVLSDSKINNQRLVLNFDVVAYLKIGGTNIDKEDMINVRTNPFIDAQVDFQIKEGTRCLYVAEGTYGYVEKFGSDYWYQIKHNGKLGWVLGSLVEVE